MTGRHLHLMGVGGVGMCGLAEVLHELGAEVSGCDVAASERTDHLAGLGMRVSIGHDPGHLDGVDALVVTAAVPDLEPELGHAWQQGLPVVRRAELLGELMRGRLGIAVAGTHGKTTTTALIGHLLIESALDPTVIVGGRPRYLEGHGRLGSSALLVCEADEYDRAFLELGPEVAVVTNLEPEHMDCYASPAALRDAFLDFAHRTATLGPVVVCLDDPGARGLLPDLRRRPLTYGVDQAADIRGLDVEVAAGGTSFRVDRGGTAMGTVRLEQPGLHLLRNALAAIAVGLELGVEFDDLAAACGSFAGVARRFERRGERDGVTVIDDYAHHPTEIRATLDAARQAFPERRLIAVFQPHLYSRTREFASGFGEALNGAEIALVLPVYPAREAPIPGVDSSLVVMAARASGHPAALEAPPVTDAIAMVADAVRPGDVVLTLGAGDVWRVGEDWLSGGAT